jgi:4-diphosphocytidyl-2-C-methyl-D-erythritol kinase
VTRAPATAKLNLALVVGRAREDGKHEVATVYQRLDLADRVAVERGRELEVAGFADDTLVRRGLERLAETAGAAPGWHVRLTKRIPVAALRLANDTLVEPLPQERLRELAAGLGSDVPFFLEQGPQLGQGDGSELTPLELPQDYWVVLVLPRGAPKASTAAVYEAFDERDGGKGFRNRRAALRRALANVERPHELANLPRNDLASSTLAEEFRRLGAFRADVTGAGPTLYGLFLHLEPARAARRSLDRLGRTWLTVPAWYG